MLAYRHHFCRQFGKGITSCVHEFTDYRQVNRTRTCLRRFVCEFQSPRWILFLSSEAYKTYAPNYAPKPIEHHFYSNLSYRVKVMLYGTVGAFHYLCQFPHLLARIFVNNLVQSLLIELKGASGAMHVFEVEIAVFESLKPIFELSYETSPFIHTLRNSLEQLLWLWPLD